MSEPVVMLCCDEGKKILAFQRGNCIFALNFNVKESFGDYWLDAAPGSYRIVLDSDSPRYGGFGRNNPEVEHFTFPKDGKDRVSLYLPCRSALVLKKM